MENVPFSENDREKVANFAETENKEEKHDAELDAIADRISKVSIEGESFSFIFNNVYIYFSTISFL